QRRSFKYQVARQLNWERAYLCLPFSPGHNPSSVFFQNFVCSNYRVSSGSNSTLALFSDNVATSCSSTISLRALKDVEESAIGGCSKVGTTGRGYVLLFSDMSIPRNDAIFRTVIPSRYRWQN